MTRESAVERLRENRETRRYTRHVQLVGRLLDEQLVAAGLRRGLEDAVRFVRQVLVTAEQADEPVDAIVVRRDVVVADRPVVAESVSCLPLKIPGTESQRDAPPVIRPSAEHAGP